MPYSQVRINKTKDMQKVLDFLKMRFPLLSETEIIKMLLSEAYYKYSLEEPEETVQLFELPEEEITPELRKKMEETQKMDESEFLNL